MEVRGWNEERSGVQTAESVIALRAIGGVGIIYFRLIDGSLDLRPALRTPFSNVRLAMPLVGGVKGQRLVISLNRSNNANNKVRIIK